MEIQKIAQHNILNFWKFVAPIRMALIGLFPTRYWYEATSTRTYVMRSVYLLLRAVLFVQAIHTVQLGTSSAVQLFSITCDTHKKDSERGLLVDRRGIAVARRHASTSKHQGTLLWVAQYNDQ